MKKIVLIISLSLLGIALFANPVTPEKALQVASRVFASGPSTKAADASSLQIVWDGEFEPATKAAQDPAFYVVSRPEGGFVMVAGNDNVQPVLAFSFENPFVVEGMPENVRAWMEQYKGYVRSAKTTTVDIQAQWSIFEETKALADPITPVTDEHKGSNTNEWDQTNPANYYCPDVDVEHQTRTSVCGCVALATAEVMAWFGESNLGTATNYHVLAYSYQSENEGTPVNISENVLTTEYDWAGLKSLSAASAFYGQVVGYSDAEAEDKYKFLYYGAGRNRPGASEKNSLTNLGKSLAHLTYDIGTLIHAKYNEANSGAGHNGTGAITSDVVRAVAPVMHYNNGARYVKKDGYTNGEWESLIKAEIDQHPVIYNGSSATGGHAYVADGYATYSGHLVFHFNMGWGGRCNGYYNLNIQENYNASHGAILGFYPNSTSYAAIPVLSFSGTDSGMANATGYNSGTLSFSIKNFYNSGSADFTGNLYVARIDESGSDPSYTAITSEITEEMVAVGSESYLLSTYSPFEVTVSTPKFGDQLVAYYKEKNKSTYLPFSFDPLNVGLVALPVYPAAAIKVNSTDYHTGDYFEFALTNHNYVYQYSTWRITPPGESYVDYDYGVFRVPLTKAGDYKIEAKIYTDSEKNNLLESIVTYIKVTAP